MLSQVTDTERVAWVRLKGSLEVGHRLFSHFEVVHVGCNLNDASRCQSHWVVWIQFDCLVHAQFGLRQVSKAIVAEPNTKPDVRGAARVFVHHLLQETQTLLSVAFCKLNYGPCENKEGFNRCGRVTRACFAAMLLKTSQLLLTVLIIVWSLFELASRNFVKALTAEAVHVRLRGLDGFFDQFVTLLAVLSSLTKIWLSLHEVQLVASENVQGSDALFLVLEQMGHLYFIVKAFVTKGPSEKRREIFGLTVSVVHQLIKETNKIRLIGAD